MASHVEYSSNQAAGAQTFESAESIGSVFKEIAAGLVVASLSLPLCIAAGVLAFAPLGQRYSATGAVAGVFCAALGGLAAACVRRSSFVTTIPTTPIAVIQASFIATVIASAGGHESLILVAVPAGVICTGLWQLLFAASGLSRVVKFVPHAVVAGFVTGVGLLIVLHQLPVFLAIRSLSELGQITPQELIARMPIMIFGAGIISSIFVLKRLVPTAPNLLVALVFGTLAFYVVRLLGPQIDLGNTVGHFSDESTINSIHVNLVDWKNLLSHSNVLKTILISSLTLSIVGTLDTFFSLRTAQALADIKFDPRRELAGQAVGNLLSAIVGGLVVSTSLSLTTANYEAGGRTRISTVTSAIALLAGGLLLPKLILSLPLAVLASILIAASYRLIDRECIETARIAVIARTKTRRLRALRDMGTVLAVLLATVLGQPIMGVLVGFGLSCLIFLIDMSRPVIARQATGAKVRSKRIRSHVEQDCLRRHGDDIKILDLQGALFFGNAYNLTEEMRSIEREARIIILNCRKISNVDHSGLRMLGDMIVRLKRHGKLLAISDDRSKCVEDFSRLQTKGCGWHCFVTVDEALEWAENQILDAHLGKNRLREVTFEQSDLANDMTQTELAALMSNMSIEQFEKGSALCRTGDPSDRIWILTRGAVSVRVSGPDAGTRLAMLGPGCTVGEMGLLTGRSRSADVWADDAVTAYVLTAKKFDEIQHENPKLGQRLLLSIARQLTRRLVETSEELRLVNS